MAQITTYFTSSSGGGISGSGAAGEVAFFTAPTVLDSDSNLAWDDTNRRLSLNGPNTVGSTLVIAGDGNTDASSAIDVRTSLTYGDITVFKVYDNGRIDSQVLSGTGTGGTRNVAIGVDSGRDITTGQYNTLIGYSSGLSITEGTNNTIIGSGAGSLMAAGSANTAVGTSALSSVINSFNTAVGAFSGQLITDGLNNSALGVQSIGNCTTGSDNVAVGNSAGRYRSPSTNTAVNPTDSIYIGSGARSGSGSGTVSNEIVIGKGTVGNGQGTTTIGNSFCTDCFVFGNIQPTGSVYVADGQNIVFDVTNGTKIGTSASQKLAFWNATPNVQPTSAITSVTADHGTGTSVKEDSKYNGYDLGQIVAALQRVGILA